MSPRKTANSLHQDNSFIIGLKIFIRWVGFLLILPINIIIAVLGELKQFITYPYRVNQRIIRIKEAMSQRRDHFNNKE